MDKYVIPNLRNACRLLKAIAHSSTEWHVADLSRELGIPATTALRIVHTLEQEGFVRKDGRTVRLGPSLIHLGHGAVGETELRQEAVPVLQSLAQRTDETAHVAVPCEGRSLIVAVCDSPHPLRAASRPGTLAEMHCSSTGKVLLAHVYHDRLTEFVVSHPLTRHTPNTLTQLKALRDALDQVRRVGYAVDDEEFHPGVRCLAAPVFDARGKVVAGIGITAAATRFTAAKTQVMAAHVLEAASELSRRLGHVPA